MRRKNQKDLSQTTLSGSAWNLCLHRTGKSGNIRTRIYRNDPERSASQAVSFVANGCAAQDWGQVLRFEGKTCSLFGSFTSDLCDYLTVTCPDASPHSAPL